MAGGQHRAQPDNGGVQEIRRWLQPTGQTDKMSTIGLQNTLDLLAKLKMAKMKASDPHELVRCNEVMNLIDVGILMVRAAFEPDQFKRGIWFLGKLENGKASFRPEPIKVIVPTKGGRLDATSIQR